MNSVKQIAGGYAVFCIGTAVVMLRSTQLGLPIPTWITLLHIIYAAGSVWIWLYVSTTSRNKK